MDTSSNSHCQDGAGLLAVSPAERKIYGISYANTRTMKARVPWNAMLPAASSALRGMAEKGKGTSTSTSRLACDIHAVQHSVVWCLRAVQSHQSAIQWSVA